MRDNDLRRSAAQRTRLMKYGAKTITMKKALRETQTLRARWL